MTREHESLRHGFDRRRLLQASAAAAGAALLAACGGSDNGGGSNEPSTAASPSPSQSGGSTSDKTSSGGGGTDTGNGQSGGSGGAKGDSTQPLAKPASFSESPLVAAQAKAGKLPKLADRLPENPFVIPHNWATRGKYGGVVRLTLSDTAATNPYEMNYGYSFLRYMNDGQDVGPGLAEKWTQSADTKVLTFHFRKGLKWSDGTPWTTDDIMYYWDDMVGYEHDTLGPPDDVRDGKDQVATVTAPDKYTLKITYKHPAPASVDRIAAWVNGNNGSTGPAWVVPKHYAKQFHPKYNTKLKPTGDWQTKHDQKLLWAINPDCPTLAAFHCTAFKDGQSMIWERNPFYYAVTKDGDQLPYVDEWQWHVTQDPEVQKLQITQGQLDYVQGSHTGLGLPDVSQMMSAAKSGKIKVTMWDSGSGTGSITFFNFDTNDMKLAKLLGEHDFRLALSFAFNRPQARQAIYLQQGELTTGTLSPKGTSFHTGDEGPKLYAQWRDMAVKFDKAKAEKLLDKLGLKDTDGDGFREYPDGSKLKLYLDRQADAANEHVQKCNRLARDWKAVGLNTTVHPVPPTAFGDEWGRGALMTTTAWEVGDNSPLVYPGWVVPVVNSHWAPLSGEGYNLRISDPKAYATYKTVKDPYKRKPPFMVESDGWPMAKTIAKLQDTYDSARIEPDPTKRMHKIWDIIKIHIQEGPFFYGIVANYPTMVITAPDLHNVPTHDQLTLGGWTNPWIIPTPATYSPECIYWGNPDEHKG